MFLFSDWDKIKEFIKLQPEPADPSILLLQNNKFIKVFGQAFEKANMEFIPQQTETNAIIQAATDKPALSQLPNEFIYYALPNDAQKK